MLATLPTMRGWATGKAGVSRCNSSVRSCMCLPSFLTLPVVLCGSFASAYRQDEKRRCEGKDDHRSWSRSTAGAGLDPCPRGATGSSPHRPTVLRSHQPDTAVTASEAIRLCPCPAERSHAARDEGQARPALHLARQGSPRSSGSSAAAGRRDSDRQALETGGPRILWAWTSGRLPGSRTRL